jgi:hypothetical protein
MPGQDRPIHRTKSPGVLLGGYSHELAGLDQEQGCNSRDGSKLSGMSSISKLRVALRTAPLAVRTTTASVWAATEPGGTSRANSAKTVADLVSDPASVTIAKEEQ